VKPDLKRHVVGFCIAAFIISSILLALSWSCPDNEHGSQMPTQFVTHGETVNDIHDGETRYVVPWAVSVDDSNQAWIKTDFLTTKEDSGTSSLPVARAAGQLVIMPQDEHEWRLEPVDHLDNLVRVLVVEDRP
jgi:hypothetical protein